CAWPSGERLGGRERIEALDLGQQSGGGLADLVELVEELGPAEEGLDQVRGLREIEPGQLLEQLEARAGQDVEHVGEAVGLRQRLDQLDDLGRIDAGQGREQVAEV